MQSMMKELEQARAKAFNRFLVEIEFIDQVHGTQPKDAKQMEAWLRIKLARDEEKRLYEEYRAQGLPAGEARFRAKQEATSAAELKVSTILASHLERVGIDSTPTETSPEQDAVGWCTFFKDEFGPYLWFGMAKAATRDVYTSLGLGTERKGSVQTRTHLSDVWACDKDGNVLPGEQATRLHFYRIDVDGNEAPLTQPDGYIEMVSHPRNLPPDKSGVIKRHDYIFQARLRFLIALPAGISASRASAVIDEDILMRLLPFLEGNGLAGNRSLGHGKYRIVRLERLDNNPWTIGKKKVAAEEEE